MEVLEERNLVAEIKNWMDRFHSRLDPAEERIHLAKEQKKTSRMKPRGGVEITEKNVRDGGGGGMLESNVCRNRVPEAQRLEQNQYLEGY